MVNLVSVKCKAPRHKFLYILQYIFAMKLNITTQLTAIEEFLQSTKKQFGFSVSFTGAFISLPFESRIGKFLLSIYIYICGSIELMSIMLMNAHISDNQPFQ